MEEKDTTELNERARFYQMEVERLGLSLEVVEPDLTDVASLGAGSIGQVNVAVDKALGRTVAVKMLHPELQMRSDQLERMIREAQAAAQLEHPNIVPVYSLGISPKRGVYFTMKRLKGDSLRRIISELSQKNPAYTWVYTWPRRLSIFMRICQGMAYAHSKKVLHRDLKPENVRVGNFGEVTIIDWGLVRGVHSIDEGQSASSHHVAESAGLSESLSMDEVMHTSNPTMDGVFSGTPRYMSPEQANGVVSKLDVRSDIYALGVILYELMTCYNPFYNKNTEDDILEAVRNGNYNRPRQFEAAKGLPIELERICLKAMNLNPEKRYQSVSELLADLYAHQEGRPVQAYRGTMITSMRRYFQRNPLRSVAFMSIFIAMLVFASILYVLDLNSFSMCMELAQVNYKAAENLRDMVEKRITEEKNMRMPTTKNDSYLMDIDVRYESALFYLNSIPQKLQYRKSVTRLTEEILEHCLLFDVEFGRNSEIQRHLDNINGRYLGKISSCSESLQAAVSLAMHTLGGNTSISLVDASVEETDLTVVPIENDDFKGMKINENAKQPSRKQPVFSSKLPVQNLTLPRGEYMFIFEAKQLPAVKMHVTIGRNIVERIYVDMPAAIPKGTCYVPAGKAYIGGLSKDDIGKLTEVPGFFIGKYEVTFGEYYEFWKELSTLGKQEMMPRLSFRAKDAPIPAWDEEGHPAQFVHLDRPVVGISAAAADAYCVWLGKKTGHLCRLPNEAEWEKAARGINGRLYPWGNDFDVHLGFFLNNESAHVKYGLFAPGGEFPQDCSLFGVMDMAGNVREWTSSYFGDVTSQRIIKGASASTSARYLPLGRAHDAPVFPSDVGFRVVFPLQHKDIVTQ